MQNVTLMSALERKEDENASCLVVFAVHVFVVVEAFHCFFDEG
jgi:hypothetical protein